jgi:hypothetical protein
VAVAVTITEQRYGPTTGTGTGWLGLAMCAAGSVPLLMHPDAARTRFAVVLGLAGVLIWCYLLRPRIIVQEPTTLLLRNAFSSWVVPLAAVTVVRVKAITRIEVGDLGYDAIAVGRRVKTMVRGATVRHGDGFADAGRALGDPPRRERKHPIADTPEAIADLMTDQILAASVRAQETGQPVGPVRRTWARVELALLAALLLGFALTYLV